MLAAAYDALKAVDGANQIAGVGLSPRGNDRPDAPSNVSTSPVRFLQALGDWYRASGRTLPLMDALSFHPYPNANTDRLSNGYAWPSIGLVNADRLKQAIQDAFGGTSHPTVGSGLKLFYDELGWQVDTSGQASYAGSRERDGHDRGEPGRDLRPDSARWSRATRPISAVNLFGFVDEGDLAPASRPGCSARTARRAPR